MVTFALGVVIGFGACLVAPIRDRVLSSAKALIAKFKTPPTPPTV